MQALRALIHRHRLALLGLVLAAFAIKALVPAGMMVDTRGGTLTIAICQDGMGAAGPAKIAIPLRSADGDGPVRADPTAKAGAPCAFAGLAMAGLAGADPLLLALALAVILALGLLPAALPLAPRSACPPPPLRGPPVIC